MLGSRASALLWTTADMMIVWNGVIPTVQTIDLFRSGMMPIVPANSLAKNGHRPGLLV